MCCMNAPRIRDFLPEDLDRLYEIDGVCFPDFVAYTYAELRFYLRHPRSICKVAIAENEIVAFAIGQTGSRGCGHVVTLDVVPAFRRHKVGTVLIELLHEHFRSEGMNKSVLEVDTGNEAAQQFYDRLGYSRKGILRGYYANRSDAYRMTLQL
jgi:[ribosomal protein S18]-alanine N-acetyltransferase